MKKLLTSLVIMFTMQNSVVAKTYTATYYHRYFEGRKMANGQIYRGYRLTGASMSHRLGTKLKITNLENNRSVIVTITDRGNFSHRNIDLSTRAFDVISRRSKGRIKIKIQVIR